MIKAILGIDPGFKIGLSLVNIDSDLDILIGSEYLCINVPVSVKRALAKQELVNWKLEQVYRRLLVVVDKMLEQYNLKPEEVVCSIESFFFRPGKANAVYNTVAAIAMVKAVMFHYSISIVEVASKQMRRIITYKLLGYSKDDLEKEEVEETVKQILSKKSVEDVLELYAAGHHEHIADSMALALAHKYRREYEKYMQISLKKRKQMMEDAGVKWVTKVMKKPEKEAKKGKK